MFAHQTVRLAGATDRGVRRLGPALPVRSIMDRRDLLKAAAAVPLIGMMKGTAVASPDVASGRFNAAIEQSRQAALDVLRPTPKQMQRAMELHAASLVVESYGFSPRANLDYSAYAKAAQAGASSLELADLGEEMIMTRYVTDAAQRAEYQEAWKASGVTCVLQNAGEECQSPMRTYRRLARFTYVTDMLRDFVFKAVTPDDIVAAKKQDRHCLYLSSNSVPLSQEWISVEEELAHIGLFFQLGVRMMHITYNRRNMLGDGCGETANAGLSDFGRRAVAEMNRVGVIPDVAHCGWQTSMETALVSQKPVAISHSACDALHHHSRCKPDPVIKAICDKGGYIGICAIASFLGGTSDIAAMLDHIDHAVRRFGADHVAIGADMAYNAQQVTPLQVPRKPRRPRWETFSAPAPKGPNGHPSLAWTNWPMFTLGMVQRGYKDEDIQKILGGNVLRVARATLTNSASSMN